MEKIAPGTAARDYRAWKRKSAAAELSGRPAKPKGALCLTLYATIATRPPRRAACTATPSAQRSIAPHNPRTNGLRPENNSYREPEKARRQKDNDLNGCRTI